MIGSYSDCSKKYLPFLCSLTMISLDAVGIGLMSTDPKLGTSHTLTVGLEPFFWHAKLSDSMCFAIWLKFTTSFNKIELLNCPPLKINSNPAVWNKALVAISRSASWTRALPTAATLPLQSQEKAPFSPFLPFFASLGQNKPRTGGETTRGARFFHRVVKY